MSQETRPSTSHKEEEPVDEAVASKAGEVATEDEVNVEDIIADSDDMLDEIDKLLDPSSEEFVRGFVQKGGQ